jgi:hypothetical protein
LILVSFPVFAEQVSRLADFLNLIFFGIASRSPSATTCCGGGGPGADRKLNIHFESFC